MNEISTRVWLDEQLWNGITHRAIAEETTVRELIPRLLTQLLAGPPGGAPEATAPPGAPPAAPGPPPEPGPPVVRLAEVYRCAVCGAEVRLGGLSNHLGKHLKERQSSEGGRS